MSPEPNVRACSEERLTSLSLALGNYVRRLLNFQTSHTSFYLDENQAMDIHYTDIMSTFRRDQADFDGSIGLKGQSFYLRPDISFRSARRAHDDALSKGVWRNSEHGRGKNVTDTGNSRLHDRASVEAESIVLRCARAEHCNGVVTALQRPCSVS